MSPKTLGRPRPLYATCDSGGESALAQELSKLRCEQVEPSHRGVYFWGGEEAIWRVNIYSRLANRVLIPLVEFPTSDRSSLYEACKKVRWDWWVHTSQTISVDASSHKSELQHTHFISQVVKDAVVDSMRERYEERPSVDTFNPDLPINARISNNICTLSLDTSGARLHRRGYRQDGGPAPLKETLASLLNHLVKWTPNEPLIDLTCGSGTLLIEAALRARMYPAGLSRLEGEGYTFQRWRSHSELKFKEWLSKSPKPAGYPAAFWGSDIDPKQVKRARANAERAGVEDQVHWTVGDLNDTASQASAWLERRQPKEILGEINGIDRRAVLIMNLPYGERLRREPEEAVKFFRDLGAQLKSHFSGCEAWLLVSEDSPWRHIGLKPSQHTSLTNGPISVRFVQFKLYQEQ